MSESFPSLILSRLCLLSFLSAHLRMSSSPVGLPNGDVRHLENKRVVQGKHPPHVNMQYLQRPLHLLFTGVMRSSTIDAYKRLRRLKTTSLLHLVSERGHQLYSRYYPEDPWQTGTPSCRGSKLFDFECRPKVPFKCRCKVNENRMRCIDDLSPSC